MHIILICDRIDVWIERRSAVSELVNGVEAARRISVHPSTISRWIKSEVLPHTRISKGAILIAVDDLLEADRKSRQTLRRRRHIKAN